MCRKVFINKNESKETIMLQYYVPKSINDLKQSFSIMCRKVLIYKNEPKETIMVQYYGPKSIAY